MVLPECCSTETWCKGLSCHMPLLLLWGRNHGVELHMLPFPWLHSVLPDHQHRAAEAERLAARTSGC